MATIPLKHIQLKYNRQAWINFGKTFLQIIHIIFILLDISLIILVVMVVLHAKCAIPWILQYQK